MDEKERQRRRKEALLNSGHRYGRRNEGESGFKDRMLTRAYVTAVIVGLTILLSFFPTQSAQQATSNIKQAIAYQVSPESMRQALKNTTAMLKRLDSSVNHMKNNNTPEKNDEPLQNQTSDNSAVPASNEFRPDLPEDDP